MDYEKAYSEALERANKFYEANTNEGYRQIFEEIFPELKESEDERIRKDIIAFLQSMNRHCNPTQDWDLRNRWLPYLEKLGSQNLANSAKTCKIEPKFKVGDIMRTLQESSKGIIDGMPVVVSIDNEYYRCNNELIAIKDQDNYEYPPKNREQNPSDKDEPKFKDGQWIVWKDKCYKVNYNGCGYELVDQNGLSTSLEYATIDKNAHLWTIEDAKDGDVLVASDSSILLFKCVVDAACKHYIALTTDNAVKFNEGLEHYWETSRAVHPATKEQRDLLFRKMKETGYEWDAEKKELKKIEQKSKAKYIYPKFRIGDVISQKHPDLGTITYTIVGFNKEMPDYLVDGGNVPSCSIGIDFIDKNFTLVNEKSSGWHDGDDEKLINNVIELTNDGSLDRDEKDFYIKKLESLKERVQPKQEWSEEDERMLNKCIEYTIRIVPVKAAKDSGLLVDFKRIPDEKAQDWLKSLKERVQPQQEWSEDVEAAIRLLKDIAEEQAKDYCPYNAVHLRKAARYLETCRPRDTWKPTMEQLTVLSNAIGLHPLNKSEGTILMSLFNDLKKLTE